MRLRAAPGSCLLVLVLACCASTEVAPPKPELTIYTIRDIVGCYWISDGHNLWPIYDRQGRRVCEAQSPRVLKKAEG